jgi:hypothetical protein
MVAGWFIGKFKPSVIHTSLFEVGYTKHYQGEYRAPHYHKQAVEITLVVRGELSLNGHIFVAGDIFVLEPEEPATPVFITDVEVVVVKIPSVPEDKYLLGDE